MQDYANQIIRTGISMIPIKTDGTKAPAEAWKEFQERLPSEEEIEKWFRSSDLGGAIVTGKVSGYLETIDVDFADLFEEFKSRLQDDALLRKLVIVKTPRPGYHFIYRCPSGIERNQKLAIGIRGGALKTLIESRGEGGYVCAAGCPVIVHENGQSYEIIQGDLTEVKEITAEERALLLSVARSFNEIIEPELIIESDENSPSRFRPGDDFNQTETWDNILTPHGWKFSYKAGDTSYWIKPGTSNEGIHATTNHAGEPYFYVFSTSAPPFEHECAYSKFGAYTVLNHNGDFSKAASALKEQGYGSTDENIDWSDSNNFGELLPLDNDQLVPDITQEFLPGWASEMASEVSKSSQIPVTAATLIMLAILAACLQKRFEVSPVEGYTESLSLYTVVALESGSRKTSVVTALTRPIDEWEQEQATRLKSQIQQIQTELSITTQRIGKLEKKAADEDDPGEREKIVNEITELKRNAPEELQSPRVYFTDVTSEALEVALAENEERSAIISDEGGIFEIISGLYTDGKANIDVFLKGHAGGPLRVKRKSRNALLNKIAVSLGLMVQPSVIAGLSKREKSSFRGKGLLGRFLFGLPTSNIGSRNARLNYHVPSAVKELYCHKIKNLLDVPAQRDENGIEVARLITLSSSALEAYQDFAQYIEDEQADGKSLSSIRDWASKLAGHALRIAAICHICQFAGNRLSLDNVPSQISEETIKPVLAACERLIAHARAAFDLMDGGIMADAKFAYDWIQNHCEQEPNGAYFFRTNKLHKSSRFTKSKKLRVTEALDVLVDKNMLSPATSLTTKKPTEVHFVNPRIFEG